MSLFTIKSKEHSLIYSIKYEDFLDIIYDSPLDKESYIGNERLFENGNGR